MMKNKRGSVTVFALIIIVSIITMIMFFIMSAQNMVVKSTAHGLGNLWATSILGEYDSKLYERYGIFGYYGDEYIVEKKLQFYSDYTFKDKSYASCRINEVKLYPYTLVDTDNLMKQIRVICAMDLIEDIVLGENKTRESGTYDEYETSGPGVLYNASAINSLPSYGRTSNSLLDRSKELIKSFTSVRDIVQKGTDSYLVNRYIDSKFRTLFSEEASNDNFFTGEQEYIACGLYSDEENRKSVRNRIIAMREVMNLAYIENDPEMSTAIRAAAATLTLGAGEEVGAQIIMAAWAFAESVNDYRLLTQGKQVPLSKTNSSWATDLESVIRNTNVGCIDTGNREGDYYNDYIMYLLFLVDKDTRLLRIMDLIQLNLIYTYRSDFLLKDHYAGVKYSINANGEIYEFEEKYQE